MGPAKAMGHAGSNLHEFMAARGPEMFKTPTRQREGTESSKQQVTRRSQALGGKPPFHSGGPTRSVCQDHLEGVFNPQSA